MMDINAFLFFVVRSVVLQRHVLLLGGSGHADDRKRDVEMFWTWPLVVRMCD